MTSPFQIPRIEIGADFFRQITVFERHIDALGRKLNDFTVPLQAVLEHVIIPSVKENFYAGGRPRWAPRSAETRIGGPPLVRTSKLFDTVTNVRSWTVTKDMVGLFDISSTVPYAIYHQVGAPRTNLPARPFVEYQPQDITEIMLVFEKWLEYIISIEWGLGEPTIE